MLEVFGKLGSIQFDPLAVAGRSHDLVLHARVGDYDPDWCDALYERREIFEAYNKGLSFVPASEFPWFRGILSGAPARTLAENPEVAELVLARVRADGPLSALDFERERGATTDWFGLQTNTSRVRGVTAAAMASRSWRNPSSSGTVRATAPWIWVTIGYDSNDRHAKTTSSDGSEHVIATSCWHRLTEPHPTAMRAASSPNSSASRFVRPVTDRSG